MIAKIDVKTKLSNVFYFVVLWKVNFAKIGSQSGKFGESDEGKFEEIVSDMESQAPLQQQQQPSAEEPTSGIETMAEIEKQKLFYLEKIAKEQEKTNNRLHSIIENQKQEFRNHDRMIELLYRIAYNK